MSIVDLSLEKISIVKEMKDKKNQLMNNYLKKGRHNFYIGTNSNSLLQLHNETGAAMIVYTFVNFNHV